MHKLPGSSSQIFPRAVALHDHGRLQEAEQFYQMILMADERHFGALCRFGLLRLQQRRFEDAERLFRRAVKADKRSADAHQYLGFVLSGLDRHQEAIRSYEKAIALRPSFAEAYNNLGYALQLSGRLDEAIAQYGKAIAIRSDYHEAYNNIGNALHLLDRHEQAIVHYEKALALKPDYAEAEWNFGAALRALGRFEDAVKRYERAIAIRPDYHEAYNSLGNTFRMMGRFDEAIAQYEKAVAIEPDYIKARVNRGDVLAELHREGEAIAAYDGALAIDPKDPGALTRRGELLLKLHRDDEAMASFEAAFAARPDDDLAFDALTRLAMATCDWPRLAPLWDEIPARVAAGRLINAFNFLALSSDEALQLKCASRFVRHEVPIQPQPVWKGEIWRNPKIKVAYVSCGFHRHPTAHLTAELIEIHDRSRFEIIGISLSPDDKSKIRSRLIRAFDQFYDVRTKSDGEVAALLHDMRIDIAIDRSGYTANARPGIFAARPAPIQVNYIGYPGTLGASFYDYILADPVVLPVERQPFYAEKIVHLPDTYLVNDSKLPIAAQIPTREEAGLPAKGFVFCSFNNCYKITPAVFDIWMQLLKKIDGSVLWLFRDREKAEINLRREAAARGIDPTRLVFARRVPLNEHLARHRLADLFLDTLPYNAHTTACDALWAGLPVVTCCGHSFAGRVAASLLRAIGMPDLVTGDLEAYERLALRIASEPLFLQELRDRLRRHRLSYPLFDSQRYRSHIETAYLGMWERWQRGEPPASFSVTPEATDPARAAVS